MTDRFIAPVEEWISCFESERLVRFDSKTFLLDNVSDARTSSICTENVWGYYTCINVWLCRTADLATETLGTKLRALIRQAGLISAIKLCSLAADSLVATVNDSVSLQPNDPVAFAIPEDASPIEKEFLYRVRTLPHHIAREILVFPKRFAPVVPSHSSALHKKTVDGFLEVNKMNVATERRIQSLAAFLSKESDRMLPFRAVEIDPEMAAIARIARQLVHWLLGEFCGLSNQKYPRVGPGACRNAGRSKLERMEKMMAYGEYTPSHIGFISQWVSKRYLIPHPDTRDRYYRERLDGEKTKKRIRRGPRCMRGFWGRSPYPQVCRVSSVPKSWKATRLIAIEDLCNQSRQLFMKDELMKRFESHPLGRVLPLRNQDRNRELARIAAESDLLATLDLSHASDSVVKALVRLLVPRSWWDHGFERCVPYGFILKESDERVQPLHMFATMGCGCTFPVESIVFMSLTLATILYRLGFTHKTAIRAIRQGQLDWLLDVISFMGDDIIAPSEYADAIIAVLQYFGFEVNREKSFIHGRFRESCGADWVRYDDGTVVSLTCTYWPRIPIRGDSDQAQLTSQVTEFDPSTQERYTTSGYARLTAMQHALWLTSPSAANFLLAVLRYHFPEIQPSFPYESDDVPWSDAASVRYGWYTDGGLSRDPDSGKVVQTGPKLVSYAEAYTYYQSLYKETFGADDPTNSAAVQRAVRSAMKLARREMVIAPCLTVAHHWTGFNPGWAEITRYEESLRATDARADDVILLAIHGLNSVNIQHAEHFVLHCVRPARLSTAKLTAEDYTLTSTKVEY